MLTQGDAFILDSAPANKIVAVPDAAQEGWSLAAAAELRSLPKRLIGGPSNVNELGSSMSGP